jgi:membrane-associated phospholipid phosphatase
MYLLMVVRLNRAIDLGIYALSIALVMAVTLASMLSPSASIEIWYGITNLGDEIIYLAFSIIIYYLSSPWQGFVTAIAVLIAGALVIDLKELFMLPRPPNPIFPEEGYGFPSGHAQVSSAFWVSLTILAKRRSIAVLGIIIIILISLSRLALNAHYPRDVIGGALIGSAIGVLASLVPRLSSQGSPYIYLISPLVCIFSITSYFYISRDATLLKIAGISLGLSIHTPIYMSRAPHLSWRGMDRLVLISIVGIASILILYLTKNAPPYLIFMGYIIIGIIIPMAGYMVSIARGKRGDQLARLIC